MKEVTIKSKIVGRGGASAATSPGKGVSVDMSSYLLKQIWEKVFEFRLTDDGTEYLFAKMDLAVQGGVTMYANGGNLNLKGIYDGLPIDNDTIYWDGTVLRSRGVGEGGVTPTLLGDLKNVGSWANAIATEDRIMVQKKDSSSWEAFELSKIGGSSDFSNVKESGSGNAFTSFTLSEDKKTLTFTKGQTFALKTELDAKWTKNETKISNWDASYSWGNHAKAGYFKSADFTKNKIKTTLGISDWALASAKPSYTTKEVAEDTNLYFTNARAVSALSDTLNDYVALSGVQTITGEKNFTGGLKVNGSPIVYNATGKYWKLEGDLLVTGGITMFGNDSSFSPSTITQAVNVDGVTIINDGTKLMLNPNLELGGGVTDYNDLDNLPDLTIYATKGTTLAHYGITDACTDDDIKDLLEGYLPLDGSAAMTGTLQSQTIRPTASGLYSLGNSLYLWSNVYTKLATIDGIEIKKSASGVLFIDGNLVVSGGITMYGTDGTSAPSIWDGAPKATTTNNENGKGIASFDSKFFSVSNGHVTFIGDVGGGGIESITKQMVIDALGFTPYDEDNPNGFITSSGTSNKANSLTIARTISLTGQATGSTTFDGSTNKSIAVTIPTRSVRFNGTKYTVLTNSDTTSDMPNIYAADYAGTANQVLVSGGSGSAPLWVNQSAITSGACSGNAATATTASKLSTTSKTAWGQTYWTSGGVPTNINGDMSSVGHITPNAHNSRSVGAYDTSFLKVHANYLTSGASANNLLLVGGSSASYGIIFALNANGGNSGQKMAMGSDRLYPYTSLGMSLGSSYYLWNGIYLGYNNSSVYNDNGIMFGNGQARIGANSDGSIGVLSKGNIYLRTKNPTSGSISSVGVDIDTSGNLLVTGGITMYGSSDERLKQNIRTFNASKELMNLGGVFKFEYTDEEVERNGIYKGTHIGLIYQNVKNTSLAKMCYEREDGYGALNYLDSSFISLLAGVGVEHETRIQRLERENVELKKELEHVRRTMETN